MRYTSTVPLAGIPTLVCRVVLAAIVLAIAAGWLFSGPVSAAAEGQAGSGGYGSENLAKHKPVTALTGTVSGVLSNVNDGDLDNIWFSYEGWPSYNSFIVDLGSSYSIGKVVVVPAQIHGFTISTSDDGSTYIPRYSSPWSTTSVHMTPVAVDADGAYSARYIKYEGYAYWSQYVGIYELEVYEWLASPPPPPPGASGTTNLALNKPATIVPGWGSVVTPNPPGSAVDGNQATWWIGNLYSGRPDDCYLKNAVWGKVKIDLGQSYQIGQIAVRPQSLHAYWVVLSQTDPYPAGSPWVFVSAPEMFGTNTTTGEPHTFELNGSVTARYVWIAAASFGDVGTYLEPSVAEVEVYEWLDGGADATPPVLTLPGAITMAATDLSGATVAYFASATDGVDGSVPVACLPPSGSTFAIGTTLVNCSASDNAGNTAVGSFPITIAKLSTPVTLGNLTQTYTGAPLSPTATTTPPGLAVTWTGAPQTSPGTYTVTATVDDLIYQGSASGTFTIGSPSQPGGTLVWTARSSMPSSAGSGAAVAADNGRIYYFGGTDGSWWTTREYDPATDVWRTVANMPTGRLSLGATAGRDGKLYAIGGWATSGWFTGAMEAYNPATNAWASKTPMPTARQVPAAATGTDGLIYAIGGTYYEPYIALSVVEAYNPTTNAWTTKAPMPTARWWLAAVNASDGKIYAIGGYDGRLGGSLGSGRFDPAGILNTVEAYDPATNTWTTKASMPTRRAGLTAVATPDGRIYAIGGFYGSYSGDTSTYRATVEMYDTATDTWVTETPMNAARVVPKGAFVNGVIYVIGGYVSGQSAATVEAATAAAPDTTPPVLSLPGAITMVATGPSGATVTYSASATDDVDGSAVVTCSPASGSTFGVGTTTVNCSATDRAGNRATGSFTVTVNKAAATVTLGNLTQTYTGSQLTPTATTDPPDLPLVWAGVPQTDASSYLVTATVNDASYQGFARGTFTIAKATLSVAANNKTRPYAAPNPVFDGTLTGVVAGDGITATYSTTATEASLPETYPIVPALVDPFNKLGNYSVSITNGTLTVTNSAPACSAAAPSVRTMWPADHRMVPVTVTGIAGVDGNPITITVTSIFQDEPTNTTGDGNTAIDGAGVGTARALVRAERTGDPKIPGNGRVYYISFTASDGVTSCTGQVTVGVPHDQGQRAVPIGEGPLYDSTVAGQQPLAVNGGKR